MIQVYIDENMNVVIPENEFGEINNAFTNEFLRILAVNNSNMKECHQLLSRCDSSKRTTSIIKAWNDFQKTMSDTYQMSANLVTLNDGTMAVTIPFLDVYQPTDGSERLFFDTFFTTKTHRTPNTLS